MPPQAETYFPKITVVPGVANCLMNPLLAIIPPLRLISVNEQCQHFLDPRIRAKGLGVLRYPSSAAQNAAAMAMHPARLNSNTLRQILISSALDRITGPPPFEVGIWSSVVLVRSTNSTPCFPCCWSITAIFSQRRLVVSK